MAEYKGLKAILKRFCDLIEPVGTVKMSASTIAPTWHLYCFGQLLNIADYPELYQALGGTNSPWNIGTIPSGQFRVPDMRECTPAGAGTTTSNYKNTNRVFEAPEGNPYTGTGGTQAHDAYLLGTFKDDQFQGHEHIYTLERNKKASDSGVGTNDYYERYYDLDSTKEHSTTDILNKSGYSEKRYGTTTHGKQVGLYYIIKY